VADISKEHLDRMYYEQLQQLLENQYAVKAPADMSQLIEKIQVLEQFSLDKKRVFGLFSQVDFYFTYISKNIEEIIGFSPDMIYKGGLRFAFKIVHWKVLPMALKVHQWGDRFRDITKSLRGKGNQNAYFCGVKLKDKWGEMRVFFVKQKMLSLTKDGQPLLSLLEVEEVTTIIKGDFFWARFSTEYQNQKYYRAFFSKGKKKEYADLLSKREMEILKLITQQKNNSEISAILGISKNTVERHRKNMIARTGVIDMTALIYICRLCQIL